MEVAAGVGGDGGVGIDGDGGRFGVAAVYVSGGRLTEMADGGDEACCLC